MKNRWKVSLAAIVRRAYTLGLYSESTYRRAFVQLNARGWREHEPAEPAFERPRTILRAMELLERNGYSSSILADSIGLHEDHVRELVGLE